MGDIYWGDGIHEERLPLLEDVPEEEEEKMSPEEFEQLLDELHMLFNEEE